MKGLRIRGLRGVTLIELCIVMAIIAIMGLFMAPAIGEWVDNYRIRQATRDIVSALQLARMKAISSHMQYRVVFNVGNETYTLQRNDGVWQVEENYTLPRGVNIDHTDFVATGNAVRFNPNGTSDSSSINNSIYINNAKGTSYHISVGPTGAMTRQEGCT